VILYGAQWWGNLHTLSGNFTTQHAACVIRVQHKSRYWNQALKVVFVVLRNHTWLSEGWNNLHIFILIDFLRPIIIMVSVGPLKILMEHQIPHNIVWESQQQTWNLDSHNM
jgi:hypothetical protein